MRVSGPRAVFRAAALATFALFLLGGGRSAEEVLAEAPPEVAARIEDDALAVLDGEEDSRLLAFVRFERSRPEVMELLRQAERQTEYRPELHEVRTVRTLPDGRIDEQSMKILFRKFVYRLRYREDPQAARFDWHLDPEFENDLQQIEGFWELYPYAGREGATLGRFGSRVDVGPAIPDFIQERLGRRTVLDYIENIRRWIDSGGTWRP